MNFSFLNPWFWFGAVAIAGPIWLHLRRKKERNLVRFAAVRFLDDQPKARRSPLSVRDLLLLLLRSLAVLLIVAAFAWPYLRKPEAHSISRSVVYILDNSLSRQANDGFTHDKERIIHDLGGANTKTQIAVLELTTAPRLAVAFGEDRHAAIQKIQELKPSFQRGSYLGAFRQANALLAEVGSDEKQIVLLGDNQANQWQENITTSPFLRQVQVELPKISAEELPNLWLSEPRAQRVFLGEKSRVNFTMRLGHLGPARTAKVVLKAHDRVVFEREIDLEKQPQTLLLQAQCEADPTAWLQAEAFVEGTPDSLKGDNAIYFAVPPVTEGHVALLAESPFLRLGLSPEVMRGQWKAEVLDPGKLATEAAAPAHADVLCIESSYLQSSDARKILTRYLDGGRGVFLVVNRLSPVIDACLREIGFEPEGELQPGEASPEHFQFIFSSHSIFHPFQSPDFGNLTEVTVSRYAQLKAIAGKPLVFSQAGNGLFFESTKYPAKLFVCAFGLDREQTSWPVHPTFIPFLDLTLQAARPQAPSSTGFEPAEPAAIQVPIATAASKLVLRENGQALAEASLAHGQAHLNMPDKPGLYAITLDDKPDVFRILSVNSPAKESELVYLQEPKPITQWTIAEPGARKVAGVSTDHMVGFSSILNQRIWWWMVLGSLLALTLENTWVAIKESRFEETSPNS